MSILRPTTHEGRFCLWTLIWIVGSFALLALSWIGDGNARRTLLGLDVSGLLSILGIVGAGGLIISPLLVMTATALGIICAVRRRW